MTLPNDKWEAIPGWPYCYRHKGYSAEQIERLDRRPTEMINSALGRAAVSLPPSERGAHD